MTTIRPATAADLDAIVQMGLEFRATYAPFLTKNPDRIRQTAELLLTAPHILLVAETATGLIGMLGAAVFDHFVSGDRVASELFWWVAPDARTRHAGRGLLDQYETEARARGCATVTMAVLAHAPDVAATYTRLGYTPRDVTYEKDLVCVPTSAPTT